MATLHLNLKKKWFDMIASGEKKEEYRDIKPYWSKRLFENDYCGTITFSNGYAKDRPQIVIQWIDTIEGKGNLDWGAPKKEVYKLRLGRIISKNF